MTTAETTTPMTAEEIIALTKRHTIFSWPAQGSVNPIAMVRGEGIYFWDADGKRYIDMNSQLMCVNIGHGDRRVKPRRWSSSKSGSASASPAASSRRST